MNGGVEETTALGVEKKRKSEVQRELEMLETALVDLDREANTFIERMASVIYLPDRPTDKVKEDLGNPVTQLGHSLRDKYYRVVTVMEHLRDARKAIEL